MTEQNPAAPVVESKTMDPLEIYRRNVRTMSNRQMSSHLRRKARDKKSGMEGAWASVLSIVFDNSKAVGGKIESYLR